MFLKGCVLALGFLAATAATSGVAYGLLAIVFRYRFGRWPW